MPKKRRAKRLFQLGFDSPGACGMGYGRPCKPGDVKVKRSRVGSSLMRSYHGTTLMPALRRSGYSRSASCRTGSGKRLSDVGGVLSDLIQLGAVKRGRKGGRARSRKSSFLPMRYGPGPSRFSPRRFSGLGSFPSFGLGADAFAIAPAKALLSTTGLKKVGGVGIGLVFGDILGSAAAKFLKITGTAGNFVGGLLGAVAGYEFSARVLKQYDVAEGALYGALAPALLPFVARVTAPLKKAIKLGGFSGFEALSQIRLPEDTRVMGMEQIRLPEDVRVAGPQVMGMDEEVLTEEELGEDEGIM